MNCLFENFLHCDQFWVGEAQNLSPILNFFPDSWISNPQNLPTTKPQVTSIEHKIGISASQKDIYFHILFPFSILTSNLYFLLKKKIW